jgi:hypothetical protein
MDRPIKELEKEVYEGLKSVDSFETYTTGEYPLGHMIRLEDRHVIEITSFVDSHVKQVGAAAFHGGYDGKWPSVFRLKCASESKDDFYMREVAYVLGTGAKKNIHQVVGSFSIADLTEEVRSSYVASSLDEISVDYIAKISADPRVESLAKTYELRELQRAEAQVAKDRTELKSEQAYWENFVDKNKFAVNTLKSIQNFFRIFRKTK